MIENKGLYTLVGAKPMVGFSLVPIIDEVEKREIYNAKSDQFKKCIPFEKFQLSRDDCRKLWNDWKLVQDQYLGQQFLIIEDENWDEGIFINVPAVTYVLDKWQEDFEAITGIIFNPFEMVHLIGNKQSKFWQKVQKNHYLLGLLFGFGEQSSKHFQWEKERKMQYPLRRGTSILPGHTGKAVHQLTLEDLDIPAFVIYQVIDERLEKYRAERRRCIELYEQQDFYELTTSFLKGIPPKGDERHLSDESKDLIRQWVGHTMRLKF